MLIGPGATREDAIEALDASWKPEYAGMRCLRVARLSNWNRSELFRRSHREGRARASRCAGRVNVSCEFNCNDNHSTPYSFMTAGGPLTTDLRATTKSRSTNGSLDQSPPRARRRKVTVSYYEVLLSPTNCRERSRDFTVKRIVSMKRPSSPNLPGLSNRRKLQDWKIGMPMDEKLLGRRTQRSVLVVSRNVPKRSSPCRVDNPCGPTARPSHRRVRFENVQPEEIMNGLAQEMFRAIPASKSSAPFRGSLSPP